MDRRSWNYYEVLDVSPQASQDIIYHAYKEAKKTFSPSSPGLLNIFTREEAYEWLNTIEEAYSVVGHPSSRRVYDEKLKFLFFNDTKNIDFIDGSLKKADPNPKEKKPVEGFAYTRISRYKINEDMERIISTQSHFDGIFLKKIREYKNIKLPDFSAITCITMAYLGAIEKNNYSRLPAPVFVRGYIIQYCHILDLNESKVVPYYISLLKNGQG